MPIIAVSITKRDIKKPLMLCSIDFQDTVTQSIDKIATRIINNTLIPSTPTL